jgi:hypothetical protein
MAGGSIIVGPKGDTLAERVVGEETILDAAETITERARFDPAGHYMRPDLFKLSVDFSRHAPLHGAPGKRVLRDRQEDEQSSRAPFGPISMLFGPTISRIVNVRCWLV